MSIKMIVIISVTAFVFAFTTTLAAKYLSCGLSFCERVSLRASLFSFGVVRCKIVSGSRGKERNF
jgi:hypothetical protein